MPVCRGTPSRQHLGDMVGGFPAVLYTIDSPEDIGANFGPNPVFAFGFKMEPNAFVLANVSVITSDGGMHGIGGVVNGDGGAQFFGWVGGDAIGVGISCACEGTGFAMGDMVVGGVRGPSRDDSKGGRGGCDDNSIP
jgi:hypothetical protein